MILPPRAIKLAGVIPLSISVCSEWVVDRVWNHHRWIRNTVQEMTMLTPRPETKIHKTQHLLSSWILIGAVLLDIIQHSKSRCMYWTCKQLFTTCPTMFARVATGCIPYHVTRPLGTGNVNTPSSRPRMFSRLDSFLWTIEIIWN